MNTNFKTNINFIVSEEHNIIIKATDDNSKFTIIQHDDETDASKETIIDKHFNNIFEALNYAIKTKAIKENKIKEI